MWKKDEETTTPTTPDNKTATPQPSRRTPSSSDPATIGPSITIDGEVSGDEDLLIQGRVNGSVDLKEQAVTVGRDGRVKADITGRVVTVEGEVEGDLQGGEQVILRSSAKVEGDITAPRVILEDGARFRGLVDMGEASERKGSGSSSSSSSRDTAGSSAGAPGSGGKSSTSSSTGSSSGSTSSGSSSSDKDDDASGKKKDLEKATSS